MAAMKGPDSGNYSIFSEGDIASSVPQEECIWKCDQCGLILKAPTAGQLHEDFKARGGIGIMFPEKSATQKAFALCPECGSMVDPQICSKVWLRHEPDLSICLIGERMWLCEHCGFAICGTDFDNVRLQYGNLWAPLGGQPCCDVPNHVPCPKCKEASSSRITTRLFA